MAKQQLPKFEESDNFKRGLASVKAGEGQFVTPGSPEHIRILEAGYNMSLDYAKEIVEARKVNPASFPYEVGEKAKAMLAAVGATPRPISTDPGWKRNTDYLPWSEELARA